MADIRYGFEDIDLIDWMTQEEAQLIFAADPGVRLKRPSAIGYQLLGVPVPEDLR